MPSAFSGQSTLRCLGSPLERLLRQQTSRSNLEMGCVSLRRRAFQNRKARDWDIIPSELRAFAKRANPSVATKAAVSSSDGMSRTRSDCELPQLNQVCHRAVLGSSDESVNTYADDAITLMLPLNDAGEPSALSCFLEASTPSTFFGLFGGKDVLTSSDGW